MLEHDHYEQIAKTLEATGVYRVLRRLDLSRCISKSAVGPIRKGIFIDIETTGLDFELSEAIEIGMVPFDFTTSGQIVGAGEAFQQLNQPRLGIPTRVTEITGLTDEVVEGHRFNVKEIDNFVANASLIVAHNAAFDRPFAEKISTLFKAKPWGCSMSDVPWQAHGMESRRLSDLLVRFGLYFEAHRAKDDCEAGVALLSMELPRSEGTVLASLLATARTTTFRVFAEDAPFELKDILKQRGYRWNTNRGFGPKSWWIDVAEGDLHAEQLYLANEVYRRPHELKIIEMTAFSRYRSEFL